MVGDKSLGDISKRSCIVLSPKNAKATISVKPTYVLGMDLNQLKHVPLYPAFSFANTLLYACEFRFEYIFSNAFGYATTLTFQFLALTDDPDHIYVCLPYASRDRHAD